MRLLLEARAKSPHLAMIPGHDVFVPRHPRASPESCVDRPAIALRPRLSAHCARADSSPRTTISSPILRTRRSARVFSPSRRSTFASQDAQAAQKICQTLRAAGIEIFLDQSELRGGDAWDRKIRQQIHDCALFIPVISVNAHARDEGYFRLEWKLAVDRSHLMAPDKALLLPVVIDATPQTDPPIPDRFRELQWSRLPDGQVPLAVIE